jgi:hypothetical protein
MFRDQLVATPEVAGEVPADPLATSHQQIDEVVDHDRDLRSIHGLKSDRPTPFDSHDLLTVPHDCAPSDERVESGQPRRSASMRPTVAKDEA